MLDEKDLQAIAQLMDQKMAQQKEDVYKRQVLGSNVLMAVVFPEPDSPITQISLLIIPPNSKPEYQPFLLTALLVHQTELPVHL